MLFVIDGSKALRKAIRRVFGNDVPVQRCVQHKERNVLDHLPERDRESVKGRLRRAWKETDHDIALEQLNTLAIELDRAHPGAAASLREGMEETLTVTRLGITGKLKLTLQSTNPCESMISTVRVIHRNVKHWSSGEMACDGPPPGCSRPKPVSASSRATADLPTSQSRSSATSSVVVKVSLTPHPRNSSQHSLCNYSHPDRRHYQFLRRTGQPLSLARESRRRPRRPNRCRVGTPPAAAWSRARLLVRRRRRREC